jgi:anti-sigma regulatory factor (Ser/Thr protein kinase)
MDCPNEGDIGIHVIRTLMDEVEIIKEEGKKKSIKMVKNK